jgi:polyferredoxin
LRIEGFARRHTEATAGSAAKERLMSERDTSPEAPLTNKANAAEAAGAAAAASPKPARRFPIHGVRIAVRTLVLVLFAVDCARLVILYLWAQGAVSINFGRPQLTAGLSPLSGLFDLWAWIRTGRMDPVLPASLTIVVLGLVMSLVFKRSFCSWMCPVGTVLDALGVIGKRIFPGIKLSPRAQKILHAPKTVLGIAVLGIVMIAVPSSLIVSMWSAPYWAVSDMAVLKLFIKPGVPIIVVGICVLGASLLLGRNYWCAGLCPLGGIYGLVSKPSPTVVVRNPEACISCGACSKACAYRIDVATSKKPIRTVDCTGCLDCIAACPKDDALELRAFGRRIPLAAAPLIVVIVWIGIWVCSLALGAWYGSPSAFLIQMGLLSI